MPLKLVIGPANAEKARLALEEYRALSNRAPLFVVPTLADVQAYRRELAASGQVFGVEVVRFGWLLREIARRAGVPGRAVSVLARERVAALAVARTELNALGASAATPGFPRALVAFISELEELRLDPPRVTAALRRWAGDEAGRRAYADDLAGLYATYRRELERLEVLDAQLRDAAAVDALRADPKSWGETPVVVYGFDDLTPLQRDTVAALACEAGADVTVTLTYERERTAFVSRERTFEALRALPGTEVTELQARAEHYDDPAREALHHLERTLFEPGDEERLFAAGAVPAGDALLLFEGGGARAEVELVAAHVARLLGEGWDPEEIAVVWRSPRDVEPLVLEVFAAYGVPVAMARRIPAGHTALGRGVLALLRCALLDGTADDLLAYLRTPGFLDRPGLADSLEARARQTGARTAVAARALWEERHWPLEPIDRVAQAAERGPGALCDRLAREAAALFARPHRGKAPILAGPERLDAAVDAALRGALRELGTLVRRDPGLLADHAALEQLLAGLEVYSGEASAPGRVQVTSPFAIRARRVRALFLCGLNEGVFPAVARPDPLLSDDERAEINAAAGLGLAHHRDLLAAERFLLYTAVSRPTELLALSWRTADDDGEPAVRSLFVDDVLERFADDPAARKRSRPLGAAGWDAPEAPTEREAALAAAAAAPTVRDAPLAPLAPETVAALRPAERSWSATEIEAWASCPVKWFVDKVLRPEELEPDPEAMVRGRVAHEVLAEVFAAYRGRGLAPADLPDARERMHEALAREVAKTPISVNRERLRAEARRLEADLVRHLEHAAADGSDFVPDLFEEKFEHVDLGPLRLTGRIDRVDVHGDKAVIVDYKGKTATPVARWVKDGKLQLGLYILAARELARRGELATPVGGLYQPLGADDSRPRGLLLDGADPGRSAVKTDRLPEEEFEAALAEVLAATERAVAELKAGALEPRPDSCAWNGGCAHPTICRCEAA